MPEEPKRIDMTLSEVVVQFDDNSHATYVMLFSAVHKFVADILKFYRNLKTVHRPKGTTKKLSCITYRQLEPEGPFWWEGLDNYGNPVA